MDRRHFLTLSAAAAATPALSSFAQSAPTSKPGSLRLIYFTDTHNQPELSANEGTTLALKKIKSLKPDLCIQGGDHCFDINAVPRERSIMLLDQYQKTEHILDGIPIHHVIGNHDVLGLTPSSGIATSDPLYGKKAFEQRFNTKTYRSFDHNGYHFILLDSIGITPERGYKGFIDPAQLTWLTADLAAISPGTPIVVVTHIPLVSAVFQYVPPGDKFATAPASALLITNSSQVFPLFDGHNVIAVFQGHTHINETIYWRNVPYITSGAVCGNWWQGPRWGCPEGFTVLELSGGQAHWRYEPYGWHSPSPIPDPLPLIDPQRGGSQPNHS
jgi:3',5'-cyclic AMP phosphodiesterase CpdA